MAVELDGVGNVQALNLPGVAKVEPVVWLLMLEPIMDGLHQLIIQVKMQLLHNMFRLSGIQPGFIQYDAERGQLHVLLVQQGLCLAGQAVEQP